MVISGTKISGEQVDKGTVRHILVTISFVFLEYVGQKPPGRHIITEAGNLTPNSQGCSSSLYKFLKINYTNHNATPGQMSLPCTAVLVVNDAVCRWCIDVNDAVCQ